MISNKPVNIYFNIFMCLFSRQAMKCAAEVQEELKVLSWRDWGIRKGGLQRWISVEEEQKCEGSKLGTVKWGSGSVGSIVIAVILL